MRILLIVQKRQLRGAEMFASQLGNQLMAMNNEVIMVSLFHGMATLPFKGRTIDLNRPPSKRFLDIEGLRKLAEIIKENKIDVVQSNAGDTLKFAVFSRKLFRWGAPIIYRNASRISYFIDSQLKLWFNKYLVKQVEHVASVSEVCRRDFVSTFKFMKGSVTTIQIGIDLKDVGAIPTDLLHIFHGGPVLINVGALEVEKNHQALIRIFKALKPQLPTIQLLIVGGGSLLETLQNFASELGVSDSVHLVGRRSDVLEIVKGAQAFALTSKIEGLPGVVLEAMYCNVPVIAYDVGGVSELVQDETGWLVESNNEEMFIESVLRVIKGPSETKGRVMNAYRKVVNDFNNAQIAQRFYELYEKVIKAR